jgi:hypothetical protein
MKQRRQGALIRLGRKASEARPLIARLMHRKLRELYSGYKMNNNIILIKSDFL